MSGVVNDEVDRLTKLYNGLVITDVVVLLELIPPTPLDFNDLEKSLRQRYVFREAVVNAWNKRHPQLFGFMYADFSECSDKRTFLKIVK